MGRFASTIEYYARYRKSYPPEFFRKAAEEIGLCGDETLLDVDCGPGILAFGFAPVVGGCSGLDPVPLGAAKSGGVLLGILTALLLSVRGLTCIQKFVGSGNRRKIRIW
jgi:hypothetical protein